MPYVRVTLMRARAGGEDRVRDLTRQLVDFFSDQPGFITGYSLDPVEPDGFLGRVGVWETPEAADRAAQTPHDLSLRSELNMVVEEHLEYSFTGTPPKQ